MDKIHKILISLGQLDRRLIFVLIALSVLIPLIKPGWVNIPIKTTSNSEIVFKELNSLNEGDKVYTSGKEGIFDPGIPIGESQIKEEKIYIKLFSDTSQVMFVNINLKDKEK